MLEEPQRESGPRLCYNEYLPFLFNRAAITYALVRSARRRNLSRLSTSFPADGLVAKLAVSKRMGRRYLCSVLNVIGSTTRLPPAPGVLAVVSIHK